MRYFISIDTPERSPQFLDIACGQEPYQFRFLHAAREIHSARQMRRRARRGHAHDVYHLVIYSAGENRFLFGDRLHLAEPGVLVFSGPGDVHSFGAYDLGEVGYGEVTFELAGLAGPLRLKPHELLSQYAGVPLAEVEYPCKLDKRQARVLNETLDRLLRALSGSGVLRFYVAQRTFMGLVQFLLTEIYAPEETIRAAEPSPVEQARECIESNFFDHLTVDGLAREAHLSKGYFLRAFKREFGISPIAYQQQVRVRAAKTYLATTGLRCKEIARRTGFANEYAFSRTFKKLCGLSPTAFRRRAAAGHSAGE